jgi:hypothetical protein
MYVNKSLYYCISRPWSYSNASVKERKVVSELTVLQTPGAFTSSNPTVVEVTTETLRSLHTGGREEDVEVVLESYFIGGILMGLLVSLKPRLRST